MSDTELRSRRLSPFVVLLTAGFLVAIFGFGALALLQPRAFKRVLRWAHLSTSTPEVAPADAGALAFTREVQPILQQNCLKCHGPEKQKGGLRLDSKEAALKPGESGETAIVPGDLAKSSLLHRIVSDDPDDQMPPEGHRLPAAEVATLQRWIASGAPWPSGGTPAAPGKSKHWSFQPLATVTIPQVRETGWAATPVDRFILAAQEAQGLHPNPEAPRRTLIRRLYFDLLGLPPPPEEIDAFESDPSPAAYEHLVDRLLADPHYGERWGRHWLDVARYADSSGFEEDRPRAYAYSYRDFVIRSLNADLPYDQFIQWQIAGDLLEPKNLQAVAATGFIAAGPDVGEATKDIKKDRCDELDDIVSTTGSAVLGLTLGCARCHDHKFDPIPTADYYRLTAFFAATERAEPACDPKEGKNFDREQKDFDKRVKKYGDAENAWKEAKREEFRLAKINTLPITESDKALLRARRNDKNKAQNQLLTRFGQELTFKDPILVKLLNPEDRAHWDALTKGEADLAASGPRPIPRLLAIHEGPEKKTFLLLRGDPAQEGAPVTPGTLSVFPAPAGSASFFRWLFHRSPTRADLAHWLTDEPQGAGALTARVAVNRLWQHHFGRGLVLTAGDFGVRGDPPSHPELLDWLAGELIRGGWHMKPLQKLILMSAVYRQDIASDSQRVALDPANRLWWRREPLRIEAEALRDSMLSVSGCLNPAFFGPAVKPRINPEAIAVTNREKHYDEWPADVTDGPATWRRSIYIFAKRANLFPILQAFDAPTTIGSCTRRNTTTVAPQALELMNDPFVCEQSRAFAARLSALGGMETRVRAAFRFALGRDPRGAETERSLKFIDQQIKDYQANAPGDDAEMDAVSDFCQGLIALNEFCDID